MKRLLFAALALALTTSVAVQAASASHRVRHPLVRRSQTIPTLNLAGQVLLPNGSPATGASVSLLWRTPESRIPSKVAVDAGGHFKETLRLDSAHRNGSVIVMAYMPGKGVVWEERAFHSQSLSPLKLRLQPGMTLTGCLVRSNGSPAANAELHAEALFPLQEGANTPLGERETGFDRQWSVLSSGQEGKPISYDGVMRLLPDEVAQSLYTVRTDAGGRFTLTGLPRRAILLLRPGNGLILTPNSMAPLFLRSSAHQEAGMLVATQTGSARIHILNSETRQPASGVSGTIALSNGLFSGPILYRSEPPFGFSTGFVTDQNGEAEIKNLLPGTYKINILGSPQEIRIEEGKAAPTVELALRQGPLHGRLLDVSGKPLFNVNIMMSASAHADFPDSPLRKRRGFHRLDGLSGFGFASGWEKMPIATTGPDGSFELASFPWGGDQVIVRATKNNDRAEYIGPISGIGKTLELRMKPNALISVTGRLIDPHRRPVTQLLCQALHWQSSLRPAWFASAHEVVADAQGRFRVEGLERGESFSILSNGQRFGVSQQLGMVNGPGIKLASHTVKSPVSDFESPRFVTGMEGAAQDLGDIMVHPSDTPDDVLDSYGGRVREIASSPGVLESPGPEAAKQAQEALKRYRQALRSGDVKTIHQMISPLSPDYSPQLPEFLLHATLSGVIADEINRDEARSTLRFVSRTLIGALIHKNSSADADSVRTMGSRFGFGSDEMAFVDGHAKFGFASLRSVSDMTSTDSEPAMDREWAVLTAKRSETMVLKEVLHYEAGQWRVVSHPATLNLPLTSPDNVLRGAEPQTADYTRKAAVIPIEQYAAARKAGERYLHLWAENRPGAMLAAMSPFSFSFDKDLAQFKKRQEQRPDAGLCPLNPESRVALQPLPKLTFWEQKWLANQARLRDASLRALVRSFVPREGAKEQFPDSFLQRGDLALLEYPAPSGRFLMALIKQKDQWKVLEPALPL